MGQTMSDLYAHINAFQRKLALIKDDFSSKFGTLSRLRRDAQRCPLYFLKYRANTETLQQQFKDRFQDFYAIHRWIALFTDPLSAVVSATPQ